MSTEDKATSDISVMYSLCLFLCLVPALYASMPYIRPGRAIGRAPDS